MKLEIGKYYRFDFTPIQRLIRAFGDIMRGSPFIYGKCGDTIYLFDGISKKRTHYEFYPFGQTWVEATHSIGWTQKKQLRKIAIQAFEEHLCHEIFAKCISEVPEDEIAKLLLKS